jgi:hypothetical protein
MNTNKNAKTIKPQNKTILNAAPLLERPSNFLVKSRIAKATCEIFGAFPLPITIAMETKKNINKQTENVEAHIPAVNKEDNTIFFTLAWSMMFLCA